MPFWMNRQGMCDAGAAERRIDPLHAIARRHAGRDVDVADLAFLGRRERSREAPMLDHPAQESHRSKFFHEFGSCDAFMDGTGEFTDRRLVTASMADPSSAIVALRDDSGRTA